MRKVSIIFCLFLLTLACNSVTLSEAEAMRLIREAEGFPKLKAISIYEYKAKRGLHKEIFRLYEEGYYDFDFQYKSLKNMKYKVTDKGKNLIESIEETRRGIHFRPFVYKIDIERITEILIDSDNKTAIVKYVINVSTTEYYNKLIKIDEKSVEDAYVQLPTNTKSEIFLKKWDQGWRVMKEWQLLNK
jgi:hypothetical protein